MKPGPLHTARMDIAVAFCLLTRLPLPRLPDAAFDRSARAVWSYPIVGAVLGAIAGLAGVAANAAGLPVSVAAGIIVILLAGMTGALHEDGLADTADGLWGGTTPQSRLAIMKDSQIGTYGTLALMIVTGIRWSAYAALLPFGAGPVIAATVVSRAAMPVLMHALPHARSTGLSHAVGRPARGPVLTGMILAMLIASAAAGLFGIAAFLVALASAWAIAVLAKRKIGGQTGDILGASQQISETVVLCTLTVALA